MKTEMKLRRSPTLEIGEKIKAAKSENKKLLSLSTPPFQIILVNLRLINLGVN